MSKCRQPRRAEIIELRTKYNELSETLREERYDALRGIVELRSLFAPVSNATGLVCGICGLNSSERELIENHYRSQIRWLENILEQINA